MRKLTVLFLCVLIAAPLAAQDTTPADEGGVLERFLESRLSGAGRAVQVTGFEGALSGQARLSELTIADAEGTWITLSDVVLDWSRAALLRGRLQVAELSAGEIRLDRLPESGPAGVERSEARRFALPDLPVAIEIGQIGTERLVLGAPVLGQAAVLSIEGGLSLADGAGETRLRALRQDAEGRFAIDAAFSNETRTLSVDLEVGEEAGGLLSGRLGLPGEPPLDLTLRGAGPLSDFAAELALATQGIERLTGDFTLAAPPDAPDARQFVLNVAGDPGALVAPRLRPFFGDATRLVLSGLRDPEGAVAIDRLALRTGAMTLDGSLALDAQGWPARVALDGQVSGPVALPVPGAETRLGGAEIKVRLDTAESPRWTADLDLSDLSRDGLVLGQVRLGGTGTVTPGALAADLDLALDGLAHSDPDLARAMGRTVSGTARLGWVRGASPRVDRLELVSGDTRLSGQASFGPLAEGVPVEGTARVVADDLARFAALASRELGGSAELGVNGRYALLGGAGELVLSGRTQDLVTGTPRLDPLLRGTGRLNLSAQRGPEGTQISAFDLRTEGAEVTLAGDLSTAAGDMTLAARVPDLRPLDPALDGPGELHAEMTWQAGGQVQLSRLQANAAGASLSAEGRLSPEDPSLPVDGWLTLRAEDLARFSGLAGRALSGALDLRAEGEGTLRGTGDAALRLSVDARDLGLGLGAADTLLRGESNLRLDAARVGGQLVLNALALDGNGMRVDARQGEGAAVALNARLADLALLVPDLSGALDLSGDLVPGDGAATVNLDLRGPGGMAAAVRGTLGGDADLRLSGQAPLALINGMIAPRSLDGLARFDLGVSGQPSLAALSGNISTSGARLALPSYWAKVTDLSGQVRLGSGQARADLSGRLGNGRVALAGTVGLAGAFPGDLVLTMDGAELRDPTLYDTRLDGRLTVSGPLTGGAAVGGRIVLGTTEISVPSGAVGGNGPIPQIAHRGASAAIQTTRARAGLIGRGGTAGPGRPWPLDLVIEAPGRLFVRGRGLDAELGGRVRLRGTSADVIPEGRFDLVRGRLDILSKRFALDEGRIVLRGALEPYIRFVASSETADITASVVLEGVATAPEIGFTSDPELPEEEVLARLLFGQGLENLSALQAAELAAAVATLAGGGGGGLLSRLREGTGLDDLDVTRTEEGGTELRVGKYLSENVYSEVTVDESGSSTIELNLDVTPSVTVRGRVGAEGETGLGVFYERDY